MVGSSTASPDHTSSSINTKRGRVTVPRHAAKTLKLATIASIIDQAGLTTEEFAKLL
jgi:hypothetical protein